MKIMARPAKPKLKPSDWATALPARLTTPIVDGLQYLLFDSEV